MSTISCSQQYTVVQRLAHSVGSALVRWADGSAEAARAARERRRAAALDRLQREAEVEQRRERALLYHLQGPHRL